MIFGLCPLFALSLVLWHCLPVFSFCSFSTGLLGEADEEICRGILRYGKGKISKATEMEAKEKRGRAKKDLLEGRGELELYRWGDAEM